MGEGSVHAGVRSRWEERACPTEGGPLFEQGSLRGESVSLPSLSAKLWGGMEFQHHPSSAPDLGPCEDRAGGWERHVRALSGPLRHKCCLSHLHVLPRRAAG